MSTHDIELPPLPVPRTKTDGGIELFAEYSVREYARAAIDPYKQRISELEAQMEAIGAGGVSSQPITSQRRGEPVAWRYLTPTGWHATTDAARALGIAEHHTVEPLYATPQSDDFSARLSRIEDSMKAGARLTKHRFKLDAPQPAEPISKDSDDFFTNDNPKLRGLNEPVKVPSKPEGDTYD